MKKIFMLSFANIRKTKGHTVSMFILFFIAALLLNAGMLVLLNFGGYYDRMTKELNTPDIYYIIPGKLYMDEADSYLKNHENILKLQKEVKYWAYAKTEYKDEMRRWLFMFNDADTTRDMAGWKFIGKHLPAEEMSIYLPYVFQLDGGYQLNDKFEMVFEDKKFLFTIKGFIEDVFFSSPETGPMGVYLPHDTYTEVTEQLDASGKMYEYFADLKKVNKDVENGLRDLLGLKTASYQNNPADTVLSIDQQLIKLSRTMMPIMVSVMVVAFAMIIAVVCLIVVRFRINNSIEDDMTKIGSLKAIGYTSRQIRLSIVLQFLLMALAGSIVGIALSYSSIPSLSAVFAQQSGLKWEQGFDIRVSTSTLLIILLIVGIIAYLSSRRIKKLHPIIALRGGIVTHSFRKNHLPLERSRGSLPFVFAMKSILQNKKQSLMIAFILIAVSFAQTFAVGMFYNTTIDTTAFMETPGIELSDAIVIFNPNVDQSEVTDEIKNMEEVRKIQYIDEALVDINGNEVGVHVMEDYAQKETNTVYEGRYPSHSNEIVLAGHLADMLEKKIGDKVVLKVGDREAAFIVTGLSQGAYMGGISSSVTKEGMLKLNPDFKQQSLNIYLNKGESAEVFIEKLKSLYGDKLSYTRDVDKEMEQGAGVYINIISKVGIAILVITIMVVILVLYFVINSTVVRKKRELGILKAVGFTTFQLMNQISLSFLPPMVIGVCLGSLIGITQTNVIMTAAQSGMGITKANFIITPVPVSLFGLAIVCFSYLISMLITFRIRKISAYALVTE